MRLKTRKFCPRCRMWVPFQAPEICGLHRCKCGRMFHSLKVLTDHLSVQHFYDFQDVSAFLHRNPKSKSGNYVSAAENRVSNSWSESTFCCNCNSYLFLTRDQVRTCRSLKCTSSDGCPFVAHSRDHLKLHLGEVHADLPIELATKKFFNKWSDSFWSRKDYFVCELCDGFVLCRDGDKDARRSCLEYRCPIKGCKDNHRKRYHHDLEHLLAHLRTLHSYWRCSNCNKYLPPENKPECKMIFCTSCKIYHHNDAVNECSVTMNVEDLEKNLLTEKK